MVNESNDGGGTVTREEMREYIIAEHQRVFGVEDGFADGYEPHLDVIEEEGWFPLTEAEKERLCPVPYQDYDSDGERRVARFEANPGEVLIAKGDGKEMFLGREASIHIGILDD